MYHEGIIQVVTCNVKRETEFREEKNEHYSREAATFPLAHLRSDPLI